MVLGPLALLSCLGLPLLLGAGLLRVLGLSWRSDRVAFPAWAWAAGALGVGAVEYAWLWTGVAPSSGLGPAVTVLVLSAVLWAVGRRARPVPAGPSALPEAPAWERVLFSAVLALVLLVTAERVLHGTTLAIVDGDEGGFWSFRAKVLFHLGGFGAPYAEFVRTGRLHHTDYPLLNSLLQTWTFAHAERITHAVNRLPIQLFSLALVGALAGALRRVARPGVAAALVFLLPAFSAAEYSATRAFSDALVALGALVMADGFLRWRDQETPDGDRGAFLRLSSLGAALMVASKHEGAMLVAAAVLAALVVLGRSVLSSPDRRRSIVRGVGWLLAPLLVFLLTWITNALHGVGNSVMGESGGGTPAVEQLAAEGAERLEPTVRFLLGEILLAPAQSQLLLPLALLSGLLSVLLAGGSRRAPLRVMAGAMALALSGHVLVFLMLPSRLEWYLLTAAERLAFQLTPAAALAVGLAWGSFSRPPARAKRDRVLALLVGGLIAWRVVAAAPSVVGDLVSRGPTTARNAFALSEEERIRRGLRSRALSHERQERILALHAALVAAVPAGEHVHVISARENLARAMIPSMQILLYPTRFFRRQKLPPGPPSAKASHSFVLDLEGSDARLTEYYEVVAAGDGWKLWN